MYKKYSINFIPKTLVKLELDNCSIDTKILRDHSNIRELILSETRITVFPKFIEKLTINKGCISDSPNILTELHNLKKLKLSGIEKIPYIPISVTSLSLQYSNVTYKRIEHLVNLKKLKAKYCSKLINFPKSVISLNIHNCSLLKIHDRKLYRLSLCNYTRLPERMNFVQELTLKQLSNITIIYPANLKRLTLISVENVDLDNHDISYMKISKCRKLFPRRKSTVEQFVIDNYIGNSGLNKQVKCISLNVEFCENILKIIDEFDKKYLKNVEIIYQGLNDYTHSIYEKFPSQLYHLVLYIKNFYGYSNAIDRLINDTNQILSNIHNVDEITVLLEKNRLLLYKDTSRIGPIFV